MMDSLPQISLGTAALVIFVACVGYVMLRGMLRMMLGTLVLAASVWLGFNIWQAAPELSIEWTGDLNIAITHGLPVVAALAAFFLMRAILALVARPFSPARIDERPLGQRMLGSALRLPLALLPAALLWLIGAVIVHHAGSISEIRAFAEQSRNGADDAATVESGVLHRLKHSVANTLPPAWLAFLDPLAEQGRLDLAKWIAAQEAAGPAGLTLEPLIDPATGLPIPRAVIIDEPDLQDLARDGSFATLLRHPQLTRALQDPEVRQAIDRRHR